MSSPEMAPQLAAAAKIITETLEDMELEHFIEQDRENPHICMVGALDEDDYDHVGLMGWVEEESRMRYCAYSQSCAYRDELEGVAEEDSKCWREMPSVQMFILFLDGTLRQIEEEAIARRLTNEEPRDEAP